MENKNLAILALILAILFPLIGLIVSIITLRKIYPGDEGRRLAMSAFIVSILMIVIPIILIILLSSTIAYFGVLNPKTLTPEKCTFPVSVGCIDHHVTTEGIQVVLQNGFAERIDVESLEFTGRSIDGSCVASGDEMANSGRVEIKASGCSITSFSEKEVIDVELKYTSASNPSTKIIKGQLTATVR